MRGRSRTKSYSDEEMTELNKKMAAARREREAEEAKKTPEQKEFERQVVVGMMYTIEEGDENEGSIIVNETSSSFVLSQAAFDSASSHIIGCSSATHDK